MTVRYQPEVIAAPLTPRMAESVQINFESLFADLTTLDTTVAATLVSLGTALTPVAGGVCYSTAAALALSAAGASLQLLQSGGAGAPTWTSTPTVTTLTITGSVTNPTNAATKAYVDLAVSSGITTAFLQVASGGGVRTGTTAGNTLLLQAYDTDTGPGYTTFGTLTAGTTPTCDLSTAVTMGGAGILHE